MLVYSLVTTLLLAQGGIKLGPAAYGPNAGNMSLRRHCSLRICIQADRFLRLMRTGNSLELMYRVNQAEIADTGTVYMLKVYW